MGKQRFSYGLMLLAAAMLPASVRALPVEDQVKFGDVAITQPNSNVLNIQQNSDKAVVNWQSFDIDANEGVNIAQPTADSILLNRIFDNDASEILGDLNANGHVWLLNPNGVLFGEDAQVNVGGLLATTTNIKNSHFMSGIYDFSGEGDANAWIRNYGTINAENGIVALLAPNVSNAGTITANFGTVALAATDTFTVDFYGDGLFNFALSDVNGENPHSDAYTASNSGDVIADAGVVEMTVAQGNAMVERTLHHSWGVLQANTVGTNAKGQIVLGGGEMGTSYVTGDISAKGEQAGENGGDVTVTGDRVAVLRPAHIDASGQAGGGTVRIGGEYQGQGDTATAERTYIDLNTSIFANATENGDGGEVIVWADDRTDYYGSIEAKAGPVAGDGGFVETSGKQFLNMQGFVNAYAANGARGQWLLDPIDVTIAAAGATDPAGGACGGGPFDCTDQTSINIANLEAALNTPQDVTIRSNGAGAGAGDITVQDPISWTGASTLTLTAENDLTLDGTVTSTDVNGDFHAYSGGDGAGDININADVDVGGDFWSTATGGTINIGADITSGDVLWLITSAAITANNLTFEAGDTLALSNTLSGGANNFTLKGEEIQIINNISGTGSITLTTSQTGTGIELGSTATAADLNLTDTELDFIQDGFGTIVIGDILNTGGIDVAGATDNGNRSTGLALSTIGAFTVNAPFNISGGGASAYIQADSFAINSALSGAGLLALQKEGVASLGVGTGAAGATVISDASLGNITDGWGELRFYAPGGDIDITAQTWNDDVTFLARNDDITVSGVQTLGANNLTFGTSDSLVNLNAAISGTGTLTFSTTSGFDGIGMEIGDDAIAAGAGATNPVQITDASLANISDGWSSITFGGPSIWPGFILGNTGDIYFDPTVAFEFSDPVVFAASGDIVIDSGLTAAAASNAAFTFQGADSNIDLLDLNANILLGPGDGTGSVSFTQADLIDFDADVGTSGGDVTIANTVAAVTLSDDLTLNSDSGTVSVGTSGITGGANDVTLIGDEIDIAGNISTTGNVSLRTGQAATDIQLGSTATAAALNLTDAELDFIQNGLATLAIGSTAHTGNISIDGAIDNNNRTNNLAVYTQGNITLNANMDMTGSTGIVWLDTTINQTNFTLGSIIDGGGAIILDGNSDLIMSASGIGSSANPIETQGIADVAGGFGAGGFFINNTGAATDIDIDSIFTYTGITSGVAVGTDAGIGITNNVGSIVTTAGSLVGKSISLDATGTITADVDANSSLDIGNNSTATTLTGLLQGGNTQAQANQITGGPGNNANYTFEGLIIRNFDSSPPAPEPEPEPEPDPEPEPEPEVDVDPEPEVETEPEITEEEVEEIINEIETTETEVITVETLLPDDPIISDVSGFTEFGATGGFDFEASGAGSALGSITEGAVLYDGEDFTPVATGYVPQVGDHIFTGFDTGFVFFFDESSVVKMARDAEMKVKRVLFSPDGKNTDYIDVKKGAVGFFSDREKHKGEVKTILPGIAIKVTGTCYIVDYDETAARTDIALFGGGIELYIQGHLIKLKHPIQMISFDGTTPESAEPIKPAKISMSDVREMFKDRPEVIPSKDQLLKCGVPESETI